MSCKLYRNTIEYYTSENNSMAFSTKKSAKDLMISKEKAVICWGRRDVGKGKGWLDLRRVIKGFRF